jgi:hypothetical protein
LMSVTEPETISSRGHRNQGIGDATWSALF